MIIGDQIILFGGFSLIRKNLHHAMQESVFYMGWRAGDNRPEAEGGHWSHPRSSFFSRSQGLKFLYGQWCMELWKFTLSTVAWWGRLGPTRPQGMELSLGVGRTTMIPPEALPRAGSRAEIGVWCIELWKFSLSTVAWWSRTGPTCPWGYEIWPPENLLVTFCFSI